VLQQRCLRATRALPAGHVLQASDLEALRPAPAGALRPYELPNAVGQTLAVALEAGDALEPAALVGAPAPRLVVPA
jgi:sialic acid synthase SpsE